MGVFCVGQFEPPLLWPCCPLFAGNGYITPLLTRIVVAVVDPSKKVTPSFSIYKSTHVHAFSAAALLPSADSPSPPLSVSPFVTNTH